MILAKAGVPADIWPGMGVAGGLVVLAIGVATVLLWRNMNHQIKRVKVPTAAELLAQDRARREARQAGAAAPGRPVGASHTGAARPPGPPANGRAHADERRGSPPSTDQR